MKLLYIIVNSKPESESSSRKVARRLVNKLLNVNPGCVLEEVNLYDDHIPRLEYKYFKDRNCIIDKDGYDKLDEKDKKEVDRINELCDQFKSADIYVISAPMWSLSFPAPLKEYIDCIIQTGKTMILNENKIKGTLDDKVRKMIYVQSSGGIVPWILRGKISQGVEYVEDIMKFLGIKKFKELLIDGTGFDRDSKMEAEEKAIKKIDDIIDNLEE
ncbi:FMN-dependent NADH-azoreductase [Eubacterium multiforme]|uniref:FMN dependent NADH:quinone oxidoreductase n=1 Tax=Eubacterium multiforme TaxID=83339 RepID=A0ABT9UT26_9FIRM|nr:NAD(P)H-dependent oxidoreductase [Eubacterium multiforme]MDQ0149470.1 FMN-dependent NADH-azoreductase [Eubacterium multiforme]